MLTIPYIREHKEECINRLSIKNFTRFELLDEIIALDDERRKTHKKTMRLLLKPITLHEKLASYASKGRRQRPLH